MQSLEVISFNLWQVLISLLNLLLLYLMFSVVIPQLIDSVVMLINNAETYYNKIYGWITNLLDKNPKVEDWVNENLETYYQNLLDLLTN